MIGARVLAVGARVAAACGGASPVVRALRDGDILRGWRRSVRQEGSDVWRPAEEVAWKAAKFVVVARSAEE
jgi:hypothetical protein